LLHTFSLVLQPWMSAYIRKTDGVRFRSPSFGPQKTITTWLIKTEIFTLHWINIIIRSNKCIFTKLNAGHMPEDREMPEYCPVRNFETYLQKLHPQCNRLWQFPKDSFNISDECWFQKRPIGKDTLASFMSTLSKKNRPFTNLHQPLNSCNGCNYPRKKLFNGTNYGSYRTQICLVSCSISTCFIKGKTSYGRHLL
jgi:hypothetical protein